MFGFLYALLSFLGLKRQITKEAEPPIVAPTEDISDQNQQVAPVIEVGDPNDAPEENTAHHTAESGSDKPQVTEAEDHDDQSDMTHDGMADVEKSTNHHDTEPMPDAANDHGNMAPESHVETMSHDMDDTENAHVHATSDEKSSTEHVTTDDHHAPVAASADMQTDAGSDSHDMHAHDMHMHSDAAVAPPGIGASSHEIQMYLTELFALEETHSHDHGSGLAGDHMAAMSLVDRSEATKVAIGSGDWFDPSIWADNEVPGHGDRVLVPEGVMVKYAGVSDADLFTVRVDGALEFAHDTDSQMIFDTMIVSSTGRLEIGTKETPVDPDVNIDLIVADNGPIDVDWDPNLLSRGLISHGHTEIHGMKKDSHEKVIEDPMAGDTFVTFAEIPEGWQVGDTIVVAGTTYDGFTKQTQGEGRIAIPSEDEVREITAIDGNRVYFEDALIHDHDTPRADLKTSVANYTRNVSIESENADELDVSERGHVMFMHTDNVDVRYAEFHELGRTDKSTEAFDASDFDDIASDSNVKGRYALHIHRAGSEAEGEPAVLDGNAVFGSPGWGIVHHDSYAHLENNATYNTFGAGFVSESGNETGYWHDNIAIHARGIDWLNPKLAPTPEQHAEFDLGNSGDGFWLQSRMIEVTDNIAASVNAGFNYFHRGAFGDDAQLHYTSDDFIFPEAVYYDGKLESNISPILESSGNEVFASRIGLFVLKGNPDQTHDVRTVIDDFTAWSIINGVELRYTSHYTLSNFDLIGRENPEGWHREWVGDGILMKEDTSDIIIRDSTITDFKNGVDLFKVLRNEDQGRDELHEFFVINTDVTDSSNQDILNYDPQYDTLLDNVVEKPPTLTFDTPLVMEPWQTLVISGTKTDSLGEAAYPNGTDNFDIHPFDAQRLLQENGYFEASDGNNYLALNVYFSDRYTAEVYKQVELVRLGDTFMNKSFNWAEDPSYAAKFNGTVDIEDLKALADAPAVKVLDPLDSGTEVFEESVEISALWTELTQGQDVLDETPALPESSEDMTHMLMDM